MREIIAGQLAMTRDAYSRFVIPSKRSLRSEEPVLSEVEGIWARRAMWRVSLRHNDRAFDLLPYQASAAGSSPFA
jgi:hypothetical protein